jgi:hypothetical protein
MVGAVNHVVGHGYLGIRENLGEVTIALSHDPLPHTYQKE